MTRDMRLGWALMAGGVLILAGALWVLDRPPRVPVQPTATLLVRIASPAIPEAMPQAINPTQTPLPEPILARPLTSTPTVAPSATATPVPTSTPDRAPIQRG